MKKLLIMGVLSLLTIYFFSCGYGNTSNEYFKVRTSLSRGLTVITINSNSMKFSVDTKKSDDYDFYLNANFFKPDGSIEGLTRIDGKNISNQSKFGGSFYTVNNKPYISMHGCPSSSTNCVQTSYRGIINGSINTRVTNTSVNSRKVYRTLIGKNKKGDLVIIHSTRWGFISMKGICEYGLKLGLKDALLFDGGSSIDIKISKNGTTHRYQSVPTLFKYVLGIKIPPTYIVGKFE